MADEATDTTTSPTNETAAPGQSTTTAEPANVPAGDQARADTQADTSALGGAGLKEGATTEGGATEGETTTTGAPEKYEFALEGVDLDKEMLTEAEPLLREFNLDNDQANKLLPVANKLVERTREGVVQQITDLAAQQKADWLSIAKADETIGGAKWDNSLHLAAKAFDALGFKEGHPFRQALDETGFGNHRDMIFAFSKVGEMVGEDGSFARENVGATQEADVAKRLYPND